MPFNNGSSSSTKRSWTMKRASFAWRNLSLSPWWPLDHNLSLVREPLPSPILFPPLFAARRLRFWIAYNVVRHRQHFPKSYFQTKCWKNVLQSVHVSSKNNENQMRLTVFYASCMVKVLTTRTGVGGMLKINSPSFDPPLRLPLPLIFLFKPDTPLSPPLVEVSRRW